MIIFDDENEGIINDWVLDENFDKHRNIKPISVPSCWEEINKNYEGIGIYCKKFDPPKG